MLVSTRIQPLARDVSDAVRSSQAVSSPAQAALELVYNALDAGATEVVVALDVGALSITVRDNGRGRARVEGVPARRDVWRHARAPAVPGDRRRSRALRAADQVRARPADGDGARLRVRRVDELNEL